MRSRRVRFRGVFGALVLMLVMAVPVLADTSGTVSVTGEIVPSPLSLTISTTSVSFGQLDSAGTAQASPLATGYRTTGGAYWVAEAAVTLTVSSPAAWTGTVCVTSGGTPPPGGLAINKTTKPETLSAAEYAFSAYGLSGCPTARQWAQGGVVTQDTTTVYLVTLVSDSDAPGTFAAPLQFSVSAN